MENKAVSVWKGTLNPALLFGLALIIYSLILYFLDKSFDRSIILGIISFAISIVGFVLGIRSFRDDSRGGVLTYGQGVGAGTVIGLYVGIILAVFGIILYTLIDPELIEKFFVLQEEQLIEQGRIPESLIEQQIDLLRKIVTPVSLPLFGIINYVISGVLISLIASIFLKREGDAFKKAMADVEEEPAE
jgi:MFS family permease